MKMQLFGSSTQNLPDGPVRSRDRSMGDRARDERNWGKAISAYSRHLDLYPDDTPIWVQLGHALKESGDATAAERCYRRAVALQPDLPDPHLHLAHLLKISGKPDLAARSFLKVLALQRSTDALRELRHLGYEHDVSAILRTWHMTSNRRHIEIGDLFDILPTLSTPTGIQRVQLGLLAYIFEDLDPEQSLLYDFVFRSREGDRIFTADRSAVALLFRLTKAFPLDQQAIVTIIDRCKSACRPVEWQSGDVYFIPGAFWTAVSPLLLPSLKAQGVRLGAYIYDLIPLTHSQFCDTPFAEQFAVAFAECSPFFDFVLTISEFVAREVTRFLSEHGLRGFPALAAPLAHQMHLTETTAIPAVRGVIAKMFGSRRFVLSVGTIEARKNHIYLYYLWRQLVAERIDVPDLVLVGKHGWLVNDLVAQLQASNFLGGRIHILHDVSDRDLADLYANCMFTIFPSFVEGWGLPVGESLARGKIVVASSESSVPEVGGEFAVYIDPFNLHSGVAAVRRLITDTAWRAELEAAIRDCFVPRSWNDAAAVFFAQMDKAVGDLPANTPPPSVPCLASTSLFEVASLQRPARVPDYLQNPLRLMFTEGWRQIDTGGSWIEDRAATLRFATDLPPGSRIVIYMIMAVVPWVHANYLTIAAVDTDEPPSAGAGTSARRLLLPGQQLVQTLHAVTADDRSVALEFKIEGVVRPNPPDEERALCVRLVSFGYAGAEQIGDRLNMLEQVASH